MSGHWRYNCGTCQRVMYEQSETTPTECRTCAGAISGIVEAASGTSTVYNRDYQSVTYIKRLGDAWQNEYAMFIAYNQ